MHFDIDNEHWETSQGFADLHYVLSKGWSPAFTIEAFIIRTARVEFGFSPHVKRTWSDQVKAFLSHVELRVQQLVETCQENSQLVSLLNMKPPAMLWTLLHLDQTRFNTSDLGMSP